MDASIQIMSRRRQDRSAFGQRPRNPPCNAMTVHGPFLLVVRMPFPDRGGRGIGDGTSTKLWQPMNDREGLTEAQDKSPRIPYRHPGSVHTVRTSKSPTKANGRNGSGSARRPAMRRSARHPNAAVPASIRRGPPLTGCYAGGPYVANRRAIVKGNDRYTSAAISFAGFTLGTDQDSRRHGTHSSLTDCGLVTTPVTANVRIRR